MAGTTSLLLAWAGTVGIALLLVGLAKARNPETRTTVSAIALVFWIVFTFGSYGVFLDTGERERFTMFAMLGFILTLVTFVVLVYNAFQALGIVIGRRGKARA